MRKEVIFLFVCLISTVSFAQQRTIKDYNRQNETCNFLKRNVQNFSFFASFFLLLFRPIKDQLNAD